MTAIPQIVSRCGLWWVNVVINRMGPRNWSLVGNKRWLLLGGSKCTIFVVVAIGEHDLVSPERSSFLLLHRIVLDST